MSIYITGDTHGTFDLRKVVYFFKGREEEFSRDDYLIICGDVGVCGFMASDEAKTRDILRNLPVTVLFVDGNHENFEQLNSYAVEIWNGGKVHFIESNIIHLMRGQVFEIDGKKFFTFGGAYSVDKMYRTEGITWFPEEIPSKEEYEEGWKNLEKADFQVDYILSHTAPREVAAAIGYGELSDDEVELRQFLQRVEDETEFTGTGVVHEKSGSSMTMEEIATAAMCNNGIALEATESNCSPVSPPPYMAGAVEIELDKETGEVKILDYAAVVDCGTVINPNLARVQVEGGLVQGIGMTLFENIQYTDKGQMINNSFMQYKVPTRLDMGKLRVEFRSSYEPTGPFGAKSIGEIVINTPAPALAHAIYNATGLWFRELPITSEQIAMGIAEKECE